MHKTGPEEAELHCVHVALITTAMADLKPVAALLESSALLPVIVDTYQGQTMAIVVEDPPVRVTFILTLFIVNLYHLTHLRRVDYPTTIL